MLRSLSSLASSSTDTVRQRPLRIAFVSDCLDGNRAGGVISARRFVERLRQTHEVVVVGTEAKGLPWVAMAPVVLPSKRYTEMGFVIAKPDRAQVAAAVARAEVVYLQFPFWLSFVALEEAKKQRKPVIAAMHVQPENILYNVGLRSRYLTNKIYDFYIAHYYNRVDTVICPTPFAQEKLLAHGLSTPTEIVSNGFAPDLPTSFFQRDPSHVGYFLVASVGRYAREKRQDLLLEAVRRSRYADHIKLVIAGAGPREAELRRLGARLIHPPEMGYLTRERLSQILNTADLFVHCGEVELEGMAVLDAMSVGLPALIANSPESAASRLALDPRFSFPAGNARALSERIDMWIEHPHQLRAARPRAAELARGYEFSANAERLSQVFQRVASRARGM